MLYKDTDYSPKTIGEYEHLVRALTVVPANRAREILKLHGYRGRSKLDADQARAIAKAQWPDEYEALLCSLITRWRWPIAHGLALRYTELADIERQAGVSVIEREGTRGLYASAEDAAAVYEAARGYKDGVHSVRVRVIGDSLAADGAVRDLIGLISQRWHCTEPNIYPAQPGGNAWYFDVRIPEQEPPRAAEKASLSPQSS